MLKYSLKIIFSLLLVTACNGEKEKDNDLSIVNQTILDQLATNYQQLPEQEITRSNDGRVYAQYSIPTEKYNHGILGDKIEAQQLVVVVDSIFYELNLSDEFVFEDIRPRLYNVDDDSELEIITIRTNISKGAGIVIYKIVGKQLVEFAHVSEIGTSHRWLNIVAINDLDNDEVVELVWIETPHIGGTLKVAKIKEGTLQVVAEKAQYSNHAIGERNLCLSVVTEQSNSKVFYVPNQSRNKIIGFTYKNHELEVFEEINQEVDFSKPLMAQYSFSNTLEDGNNCMIVNANR